MKIGMGLKLEHCISPKVFKIFWPKYKTFRKISKSFKKMERKLILKIISDFLF
jgi:hypothetical protein